MKTLIRSLVTCHSNGIVVSIAVGLKRSSLFNGVHIPSHLLFRILGIYLFKMSSTKTSTASAIFPEKSSAITSAKLASIDPVTVTSIFLRSIFSLILYGRMREISLPLPSLRSSVEGVIPTKASTL